MYVENLTVEDVHRHTIHQDQTQSITADRCAAGLPPNAELKLAAEDALARLRQAVASTAAAAWAAEQKLSGTQALQKAAAGQLGSAQQELASLQAQIAQCMHGIYQLVRYTFAGCCADVATRDCCCILDSGPNMEHRPVYMVVTSLKNVHNESLLVS